MRASVPLFLILILAICGTISSSEVAKSKKVQSTSYNNLKVLLANLEKERDDINRQIEKTEAIKCESSVSEWMSSVLRRLPFNTGFLRRVIAGPNIKCINSKNEQLDKLKAKKEVKMEKIAKASQALQEHPDGTIKQMLKEKNKDKN